jgi:predicted adenine nucleotide alpha hydrolase (AANH) superfamily ATPase
VIELLKHQFDLLCFFYNPNIYPEVEYLRRLSSAERYLDQIGIQLIVGTYEQSEWLAAVKGYEAEPEGGKRCEICYRMRLQKTAEFAVTIGCKYFTTTLSISPHKRAEVINRLGIDIAASYHPKLSFYAADFKKRNGFKKSVEMSKRAGLYRQTYCGCKFSHGNMIRRGVKL